MVLPCRGDTFYAVIRVKTDNQIGERQIVPKMTTDQEEEVVYSLGTNTP